jgi:hypothetical protein
MTALDPSVDAEPGEDRQRLFAPDPQGFVEIAAGKRTAPSRV